MKVILKTIIISFLILCVLPGCQKKNFCTLSSESYFSHFSIENSQVYLYCNLTIENNSHVQKRVKITANFSEDKRCGLLKESTLTGYSVQSNTNYFMLSEGKNNIDVVFIGEYGGNNQKANRLLPDILITEVHDENSD